MQKILPEKASRAVPFNFISRNCLKFGYESLIISHYNLYSFKCYSPQSAVVIIILWLYWSMEPSLGGKDVAKHYKLNYMIVVFSNKH